ncbi:molybdopterin-dependent oxidoreductase [Novosphingobium sp. G106]|uniref:nitrate reductase n=1 Tax=Novosphingobium sp. G106 TaxID=2849500 RepID=UPI001C2D0E70|nr:nitrate reductase [Novosphingobium sp. G106]MBV1688589.1 molybdopterin-dependent oxidoreductase [Novosphingobium sp. G106]
MKEIRTTCAYCGVGCGIKAAVDGREVTIKGDQEHPANAGKLCSKGTHLGETVGLEGRLLYPEIGGKRVTWDRAIDRVAKRFADTIDRYGPDAVAFYVSGQLLTEDYYVANKLMKGFIGSGNIDTNSRLCMSSAVAGHIRAFGEDVVPATYEDLDQADLIVLIGSNTAWCHPIVYQRIMAARAARGTKLVVIDPRRTETCEDADLHLSLRPGSDVALMNGLLAHCRDKGLLDEGYLEDCVNTPEGFWETLSEGSDLWSTAAACDLPPADLLAFYELFANNPRTVTLFSQGINQSVRGTDQVNAIINVHLATGRIGKPGAAPFSITGQPNAMGGREVGGLASTLAAHMDFAPENMATVKRFWAAPRMASKPGLKAVDLFRQVREGRIKALWIMATNPAVSLPDAGLVREALATCPFVVVSDCIGDTDTARFAHVKLPAAGWGEKNGTVTNSDRLISRQRALFPLAGEAKPDWWIITQVAQAMGWTEAFAYDRPADIYREHARLSTYRNEGKRLFDIGHHAVISNPAYDAMEPFRWGDAPFADGRFCTPDGKARLVATQQMAMEKPLAKWPMTLNTGRYRDQWHTMTRTGLSPKLSQHRREPLVEIHPADAAEHDIAADDLVQVSTPQGDSVFRALLSEGQRRGEVFTPIHWTDRQSTGGRTGLLPRPLVDPVSGQPGFKNTPVRIEKLMPEWRGFVIAREIPDTIPAAYATKVRVLQGWLVEVAGDGDPAVLAKAVLPKGERIETVDQARGGLRVAVIEDGQLIAALFVTRSGRTPSRDWLISQLAAAGMASSIELLAGRPAAPQADRGPIVCVCFDVGMKTIIEAIGTQGLVSVEAVGKALSAGTNCGSCRPAIQRLIGETKEAAHG